MMAREKVEFLLKANAIKKGQMVLCSFGEIDIRVHLFKQAEKRNVSFEIIADDILNQYVEFLKFLSLEHKVAVWAPVASQKDNVQIDMNFPRYGSEQNRNKATKYFNDKLKSICQKEGFYYFSIFENLIDDEFNTKGEYFFDGVHLSQRAWLLAIDEFKQGGGIDITFKPEWYIALEKKINSTISDLYYFNNLKYKSQEIYRKQHMLK